tara:strand:- start:395 stop:547 length:153 start_codon:yes stop_codon:yes gene_type:complete
MFFSYSCRVASTGFSFAAFNDGYILASNYKVKGKTAILIISDIFTTDGRL